MTRPWTDERIELLRQLWQDGLSASQVAREIGGITRNAVLSKLHRMGIADRPNRFAPVRHVRVAKPKPRPIPKPAQGKSKAVAVDIPKPTPLPVEPPAALDPVTNCTLLQLRPDSCRWGIGDPREESFRFCGAQRSFHLDGRESPYCRTHRAMAYTSAKLSHAPQRHEQHRRASA